VFIHRWLHAWTRPRAAQGLPEGDPDGVRAYRSFASAAFGFRLPLDIEATDANMWVCNGPYGLRHSRTDQGRRVSRISLLHEWVVLDILRLT